MNDKITVRYPPYILLFCLLFLGCACFEFAYAFASDTEHELYKSVFLGIMALILGIGLTLTYFLMKFEYDENGFIYTNAIGKKREVSYSDIFGILKTDRNTLRLDLKDGSAISVFTSTKKAKEFAEVILKAYAENSRAPVSLQYY